MFKKLIQKLNKYILILLSENTILILQRQLIGADIYIKVEELISTLFMLMSVVFIAFLTIFLFLGISWFFALILTLILPLFLIIFIIHKNEKKNDKLEEDLPDYLRQLSALIKVGYGLESAFNELSSTINNALNDEIKRALLETTFGKSFDDALMDIAIRNCSSNLEHVFQIIIYSRESGGNLSDVLESISDDLADTLMLKKERKANVMMSVMFLLISSTIATPFALGMIKLYSEFMATVGHTNPLENVIPISSMGYVIIQAVLICILIGIVMYSDSKKGIKYLVIVVPFAMGAYFCSQMIFKGILGV